MRRLTLTGLVALGLFGLLATGRASAQFTPSYNNSGYGTYGRGGPALSPWLNLTRGGNPAANYFLGVLPEMDRRATKAIQGREISDLEQRSEALATQQAATDEVLGLTGGGLPPSGHAAVFTNYGTFYGLTPPPTPAPRQSTQSRGR